MNFILLPVLVFDNWCEEEWMLECSDSFQFSNCSWSKCGEMAKWRNNSSLGQSFKVSGLAGLFREIQRVGFPLRGGKSVLPLVLVWEQDQANAQCFGSLSRKIQIHFFFKAFFILVGVRKSPQGDVHVHVQCSFHSTLAGGVFLAHGLLSCLYHRAVAAV